MPAMASKAAPIGVDGAPRGSPQHGALKHRERAAMLKRDRDGDGGVAHVAVAGATGLGVIEKDFGHAPVGEAADGRRVAKTCDLDVAGLG